MPCLPVALALLLSLVASTAGAEPWRLVSDKGGLRMERRDVAGSGMPEVRVTAHSGLPAPRVAAAIWSERPGTKLQRRYPTQRTVLRATATERVVYQRINAPVVSERDYTVHLRRSGDGVSAPILIGFEIDNGAGPPPVKGVVRLTVLRGGWSVAPTADGGCDVSYTVHSEPGGNVPAFLVRGHYLDSARELVEDVLEWAATHP